jgi:hypothetical protein
MTCRTQAPPRQAAEHNTDAAHDIIATCLLNQAHTARYAFHRVAMTRYIEAQKRGEISQVDATAKYAAAMVNYDTLIAQAGRGTSKEPNQIDMDGGFPQFEVQPHDEEGWCIKDALGVVVAYASRREDADLVLKELEQSSGG